MGKDLQEDETENRGRRLDGAQVKESIQLSEKIGQLKMEA